MTILTIISYSYLTVCVLNIILLIFRYFYINYGDYYKNVEVDPWYGDNYDEELRGHMLRIIFSILFYILYYPLMFLKPFIDNHYDNIKQQQEIEKDLEDKYNDYK